VSIYCCKKGYLNWEKLYTFDEYQINHIHSIVPDPYRNRVWILTGDLGESSGIWFTDDNFKTVNKFLVGSQSFRSCAAFPIPQGLVYATDTPLENNKINIMNSQNNSSYIEPIYDLEGSCIYSSQVGMDLLFSTTVEGTSSNRNRFFRLISYKRGNGIKSWNSEIVIGNLYAGFRKIASFKKDILPMGLCQFGSVTFPNGENLSNTIVLYGNALKHIDGKMLVLEKK
jgi:hypothetical protein